MSKNARKRIRTIYLRQKKHQVDFIAMLTDAQKFVAARKSNSTIFLTPGIIRARNLMQKKITIIYLRGK